MEAATREVAEETNVRVSRLRLVGIYYGSEDRLLRIVFSGTVTESQAAMLSPHAAEIIEAAWFNRRALPRPMPYWPDE